MYAILITLLMPAVIMGQTTTNDYITYRPGGNLSPTFSNLNVQQDYFTRQQYLTNNQVPIGPYGVGQALQSPYNYYNNPLNMYIRPTLQTYGGNNAGNTWRPWYAWQQVGKK